MEENKKLISKLKLIQVDRQLIDILELLDRKYQYNLKLLSKYVNEPWKLLKALMELEYSKVKLGKSSSKDMINLLMDLSNYRVQADEENSILDLIKLGSYAPEIYKQLYEEISNTNNEEDERESLIHIDDFLYDNSDLKLLVNKLNVSRLGKNLTIHADEENVIVNDSYTGLTHTLKKTDCMPLWEESEGIRTLKYSYPDRTKSGVVGSWVPSERVSSWTFIHVDL